MKNWAKKTLKQNLGKHKSDWEQNKTNQEKP